MPYFAYHWKWFLVVSEQKILIVVSLSSICVLLSYIHAILWISIQVITGASMQVIQLSLIWMWYLNCPWEIVYISLRAFCVCLNNLTLALLPLGYLHRYLWRVGIFPVRTFYLFACLLWEKKCQMSVVITKDLQKCWVELELTFHP